MSEQMMVYEEQFRAYVCRITDDMKAKWRINFRQFQNWASFMKAVTCQEFLSFKLFCVLDISKKWIYVEPFF